MEQLNLSGKYTPIELAIHSVRYLPLRQIVENRRVLDIACGEGVGATLMNRWGAAEIIGVDLSDAAISACRSYNKHADNMRFIQADACEFLETTDLEFDIIVSVETIEHLIEPERFLQLLKRHQEKGADIMISCPNDHFYYGHGRTLNPFHMHAYSFHNFRSMAENYLGTADWYLGGPSTGFTLFPYDMAGPVPQDYIQAMQQSADGYGELIPPSHTPTEQPSPSTALFYSGIWSRSKTLQTYSVGFPASSNYRLPIFRSVSPDIGMGQVRSLAFVIDAHDWAFDNIVKNISPYLDGKYNVSCFYIQDYEDGMELVADLFLRNSFDNIHFMWREFWTNVLKHEHALVRLMSAHNLSPNELAEKLAHPAISMTVYDHLYLTEEEIAERQKSHGFFDAYSTSSRKLFKIYKKHFPYPPAAETPDGVNTAFFVQSERKRSPDDDLFRIGWVGNSQWGNKSSLGDDPKGLHSILVPVVERLAAEGYPVVMDIADRNVRHRSKAEMVEYYRDINVVVCASSHEGTPNPILEAMACGRAWVSTNVGIVSEVCGPLQRQYILRDRDIDQMYNKLKHLIKNRSQLHEIEAENLSAIQRWTWASKIPCWTNLFASAEKAHEDYGQNFRARVLEERLHKALSDQGMQQLEKHSKELEKKLERVLMYHSLFEPKICPGVINIWTSCQIVSTNSFTLFAACTT